MTAENQHWTPVCKTTDILPNTGVCALIADCHIAIFRLGGEHYHAIDNIDPRSGASVLSRGLVGNLGMHIVVASPLYKNHFDLNTGECIETPAHSVRTYPLRIHDGQILVATS